MNKSLSNNVTYPRYIENAPCKNDLFEGKSHLRIAENISNLLSANHNNNVIGIDGGWGSGKSNLVEIVKVCLEKEDKTKGKYKFFIYDAWGFQSDFQRRAILENLTAFLVDEEKILELDKWNGKLRQLLSKKRSVGSKTVKELNAISKVSSVIALLSPLIYFFYSQINNIGVEITVTVVLMLISVFIIYKMQIKNMIKYGQDDSLRNVINELFLSYLDYKNKDENVESVIKYETIYDDEPSSRDFRAWIHEIDNDLSKNKLIIVFDNMDRLPSQKVQELWSTIHAFFADEKYNNIRVIVPFDREHIKSAFKSEDIVENESAKKCFGDDFINKTFNVVYRVSPPTMTNWKQYFNKRWEDAFGVELNDSSRVTQIYDLLTSEQTPRKIIAFINEFVSIKQSIIGDIPNEYIALFIFGKSKIIQNANTEILKPTYLGALNFLYKDDVDLPKYISALYYQLPTDNALDIIYIEELKRSLDNKKIEDVKQIQSLATFSHILENSIVKVSNVSNAVLALNECLSNDDMTWCCIYNKVKQYKKEDTLQEYQKILLQKISAKEEYLKSIVTDFSMTENFSAISFYKSIKQLSLLENIDPFKYLKRKDVDPEIFIAFVEVAKEEYSKYKISCPEDKLNNYLKGLDIEHLNTLHAISYLKNDYTLSPYIDYLNSLLLPNVTKENANVIFERLKEVQRPIEKKITDDKIINFFRTTASTEDFYYDLICMRISCLNNFNGAYQATFSTALNNSEDDFVEKIAERIEYYMDYGSILLNASAMQQFPLYKAVAQKLTLKSYGTSRMNILNVLQKYDTIINDLELEPIDFINRCNEFESEIKSINSTNINLLPIKFFEDISDEESNLSIHCKSMAKEYLNSISIDDWEKSIVGNGCNYDLLTTLNYAMPQNCFDAFKHILVERAKGLHSTFSKDRCNEIIKLIEKNNRSLLTAFNDVRDCFCGGQATITNELFDLLGEYLLQYADLEKRKESLRTIFISTIFDKEENVDLLLRYKDKMIKIADAAGEESTDFKDKIESLLISKYSKNDSFISFAQKLGIKEKMPESEEQEN